MGGSASRLRKELQRGEEYAALKLCENDSHLSAWLDPNASYGDQYQHYTAFHFAARHAMRALVRLFLNELGANPNKRNADEANALMLVCQGGTRMSRHLDDKLRAESMQAMLSWTSASAAGDGQSPETIDIDAIDNKGNTALHYAAASGLQRCVELLIASGANLGIENDIKETPCDTAERLGYDQIAQFLETKMLFSKDCRENTVNEQDLFPVVERFNGLREQDLIEAKDLLLVETADMLQCPLFTAEALLRNHEWSRDALWTCWNRDAIACCNKARVQPPSSAFDRSTTKLDDTHQQLPNRPSFVMKSENVQDDEIMVGQCSSTSSSLCCSICAVDSIDAMLCNAECQHYFCRDCWKQYATNKIDLGDLHSITCPAFACAKLVPIELIEKVVSPTVARRYLTFDIKAFVDSNPRIKWCPHPGCANAVRLPDHHDDEQPPRYLRAFPRLQPPPPTSRAVCCPQGHSFCWDCLGDGHEPTSCEQWKQWHARIAAIKPEQLKDTAQESETAANCLWLVTHSKQCPKCKSPIQKNEGCNHIKCSKCKHDFCWVCLGQWKRHSTETGGYFRCNRFDDTRKVDERTESLIVDAKQQSRKAHELARFVHYYARFKNHLNSFEMESGVRERLLDKCQTLYRSIADDETPTVASDQADHHQKEMDFNFVSVAIDELLGSRRVLSSSYAYGYFLKDCGYNKTIFEYLQNELETCVESLSALVGRSYLRGSRQCIMQTTQMVASRKQRFLVCIGRGLVPPETPPALRKSKQQRRMPPTLVGLDKDDDDWMKDVLPTKEQQQLHIDPDRPWIRDARGRHHNLMAILDWPQCSSESGDDSDDDVDVVESAASPKCTRLVCMRACAKNPRTGETHQYCSLQCKYLAASDDPIATSSTTGDRHNLTKRQYNVDLMIAMQLSRLQLLRDLKQLTAADELHSDDDDGDYVGNASSSRHHHHRRRMPEMSIAADEIDADMQLAIERSINDSSIDVQLQMLRQLTAVDDKSSGADVLTNVLASYDGESDKCEEKMLLKK